MENAGILGRGRRKMKVTKVLCVLTLAVLALSGCGGEKKKEAAVFKVGVPHLMATYDHTKGYDGWSTTRIGEIGRASCRERV